MSLKIKPSFSSIISVYQHLPRQTIPNNNWTIVKLDGLDIDTLGEFDLINYHFTPRHEGYYLVHGHIQWFQPVAATNLRLNIEVNGVYISDNHTVGNVLLTTECNVTSIVHLTPNNALCLRAFQVSGFPLDLWVVLGVKAEVHLDIVKVG